jgi:hypothetical protein
MTSMKVLERHYRRSSFNRSVEKPRNDVKVLQRILA